MSVNSSTSTQQEPLLNEVAKLVPLSVAIVVTNLLVVVLFLRKRYLQTLSNYPLLSLAVCDFITGFLNIPLLIVSMALPTMEISNLIETRFYLNYSLLVLHAFTSTATVYHILVVIADKYLAIMWPLKHRLLTEKKMLASLAAVWVLSLIIAIIPVSWINVSRKPIGRKLFVGYGIFCLVVVFCLSYVFIMYALVVMFRIISGKASQKDSLLLRRNTRNLEVQNNRRRVCIIFTVMATVFAVCWLPWFMLSLLVNLKVHVENLKFFMEWFVPFRYVTSIINPLLYTFFKLDFRQAFKEMLWNKIVCKPLNPWWSNVTWRRRSFRFKEDGLSSPTYNTDVSIAKRENTGDSINYNYVYVSSV